MHIFLFILMFRNFSFLYYQAKNQQFDLLYLYVWNAIYFKVYFFRSNFYESLQLNGSNVANVKLKETVWHENSLNATMQKESRSRNWRILVYTACVVCLHSDSERRTSGTIYAMSCWECRSRRGGSNMWKIHYLSTTKNRAKHNGWF